MIEVIITGETIQGILEAAQGVGTLNGLARDGIRLQLETTDEYAAGEMARDLQAELVANFDTSIKIGRVA